MKSVRHRYLGEAGIIPAFFLVGLGAIFLLGIIGIVASSHRLPGSANASQNTSDTFPSDNTFPSTPSIPDNSNQVQPGIPVVTSDGTMAIPVAPGSYGVPVPTTDGQMVIPIAP